MERIKIVKGLLPVLVPLLMVTASLIVYIKLSCIDGVTMCGNVSTMIPPVQHQSTFQGFMNLWQVG